MDTNITYAEMNLNTIQEKRGFLKRLSAVAKHMVSQGEYQTVNGAIIDTFYLDEKHTEFKTFNEWKKDGYSIIKGSKAFLIWGKPKAREGKEGEPADEQEFFPMAFLFSNAQVERRPENV